MKYFISLITIILIASCATSKNEKLYEQNLKKYTRVISSKENDFSDYKNYSNNWISTVNFNLRKPNFVIIHHTAQNSLKQTINTFINDKTQVSAHYIISRDGQIVQMLNDYLRAWHAGDAKWGKVTDINSVSIGIELDNNGTENFPDEQINSLLYLLNKLKEIYNIPKQNFIAHSDIAPSRKIDPSIFFPWEKLAKKGFGVWPNQELAQVPENFDPIFGLKMIGYDTQNSLNAIKAFKLHYLKIENSDVLDKNTILLIYNVFKLQ